MTRLRHRRERGAPPGGTRVYVHEIEEARCGGEGAVVITHHAPSPRPARPWFEGDPFTCVLTSELDRLLGRFQPAFCLHGHMQGPVDEVSGSTRVVANPTGHRYEEKRGIVPGLLFRPPGGGVDRRNRPRGDEHGFHRLASSGALCPRAAGLAGSVLNDGTIHHADERSPGRRCPRDAPGFAARPSSWQSLFRPRRSVPVCHAQAGTGDAARSNGWAPSPATLDVFGVRYGSLRAVQVQREIARAHPAPFAARTVAAAFAVSDSTDIAWSGESLGPEHATSKASSPGSIRASIRSTIR